MIDLCRDLYALVNPIFEQFGFTPPSVGVIARDLSEKIETAIIQHCDSFSEGTGHCDLGRHGEDWVVKICKGTRLTINQSKVIRGENYIVVNFDDGPSVRAVWVLWAARDEFFSPRMPNSNARAVDSRVATDHIERLYEVDRPRRGSHKPAIANSQTAPARSADEKGRARDNRPASIVGARRSPK